MNNRKIFPMIGALALGMTLTLQAHAQSGKAQSTTFDLIPSTSTRQIVRVETVLEGKGTVIPDEDKALKLIVNGRFQYDERIIARTTALKSIRSYDRASAQIRLADQTRVNSLGNDAKIIIAQTSGIDEQVKLASIGGPINQTEFELINTPANTLILAELFKKKSVAKDESWKPSPSVLARFLNIDDVNENEVEIRLQSVVGKTATLFIGGDVVGTIDGASTEIAVSGTADFDMKLGIVSKCSVTLSQQKDIGLLAPGLDAVFKIISSIKPVTSSPNLTDQGLARLRENAGRITDSLVLKPAGTPSWLTHPREWRVISNTTNRTVLRYIDRGAMLGQCDIIPLPKRITETQTIEQFKQVVKNSLSENSAEITGANQMTIRSGLDVLRVDAEGTSNGVQLNWVYYTITHRDGRRVQMVFTTEPENAASFAGSDRLLINSLRFNDINSTGNATQNASFARPGTKAVGRSGK